MTPDIDRRFQTTMHQLESFGKPFMQSRNTSNTPIQELKRALDTLNSSLSVGDDIYQSAQEMQYLLTNILETKQDYKKNFKNYSCCKSWKSYLKPLQRLKEALPPHQASDSIQKLTRAIDSAQNFVDAEVNKQKGFLRRQVESTVENVIETVQTAAQEKIRKVIVKTSDKKNQTLSPMATLQKLIAYSNYNNPSKVSTVVLDQIKQTLYDLESPFKGISHCLDDLDLTSVHIHDVRNAIKNYLEKYFPQPIALFEPNTHVAKKCSTCSSLSWCSSLLWIFPLSYCCTKSQPPIQPHQDSNTTDLSDLLNKAQTKYTQFMFDQFYKDTLETSPTSLIEISAKIDQTLSYIQDPSNLLKQHDQTFTQAMRLWSENAYNYAKIMQLKQEEVSTFRTLIMKVNMLIEQKNYVEALNVFKSGLEQPFLTTRMVSLQSNRVNITQIDQKIKELEHQKKTLTKQVYDPSSIENKIEKEQKLLVENIIFSATFQTMRCLFPSISDLDAAKMYERLFKKIEPFSGKEKQQRFVYFLKTEIDQLKNISHPFIPVFLLKFIGKWILDSFIHNKIQTVAEPFTNSLLERVQMFISQPNANPLQTHHLNPIRWANNALISRKQAEERFQKDPPQGKEAGGLGKQARIKHFLELPELNQGYHAKELIKKVAVKAIDEFLHLNQHNQMRTDWTAKLISLRESSKFLSWNPLNNAVFVMPVTALIQCLIILFKPIFSLLDFLAFQITKFGASVLIYQMDLVNSVLEQTNNAVFGATQYTNDIDAVLLQQLKEIEKLLDQEGEELTPNEGNSGTRIFEEAIDNLFEVLDKRGDLTSLQKEQKSNMLENWEKAVGDKVDVEIKKTATNLMILSYQLIRSEEQMKNTLSQVLTIANQSLIPKKSHLLAYYAQDMEKIEPITGQNPNEEALQTYFTLFDSGVVTQKHDTVDAKRSFFLKYNTDLPLLAKDFPKTVEINEATIEQALKVKYQQTEQDIHQTLEKILKKSVQDAVISKVNDVALSSEETLLRHLNWMEQELTNKQSLPGSNYSSYMQQMHAILESQSDAMVTDLCSCHLNVMKKMKNNLNLIIEKEKLSSPLNVQISTTYTKSTEVLQQLDLISDLIMNPNFDLTVQHDLTLKLNQLSDFMYKNKGVFSGIKYSLQTANPSAISLVINKGKSVITDTVTHYVHSRLQNRAREAVLMYKDPNTAPNAFRHMVCLPFLKDKAF